MQKILATNGHIFACSNKTEKECIDRMLFAAGRMHGDNVLRVKKGDILFLFNVDTNTLYGVFYAKSDGQKNVVPEAWKGKYPYQVRVRQNGKMLVLKNAKKILSKMGISWQETLDAEQTKILQNYIEYPDETEITRINNIRPSKPRRETTTLWDYPQQSYGEDPKGDNKYAGVTPAFIIYNLIKRYTEYGDLVLDPMAGSGTTLDVCKEEGRRCIAYDIVTSRSDIVQNDARSIPLSEDSVDMIFIDSPYGDNIDYNNHPRNIGKLSAEDEEFYKALDMVMAECYKVLRPGKVLGWLIGDQWVKKKFTPVGFRVYEQLCKYFDTVDIICVARRKQTSNTKEWYNRALRHNFYLRGFKYLFIMRKPAGEQAAKRKVSWTQYPRS